MSGAARALRGTWRRASAWLGRALAGLALLACLCPTSARAERVVFAAPLVSYDSNLLLGLGGWSQVVVADPTGDWPYRASVAAQLFWTTGGYQSHFLRFDLPGLMGSDFRWDVILRRVIWEGAPYYGVGGDLPADPSAPDGYYTYDQSRDLAQTGLRRALAGPWEIFGIYGVRFESVGAYADTLLALEQPEGIAGGRYASLELGGLYDTRDNEIDPRSGWTAELSARTAGPWVGSEWTSVGANASHRRFVPLGEKTTWATRLLADMRWGDEPFFNMAYGGGLGRNVIGGRWVFRGYKEERFRGDGVAAIQQELRWRFASSTLLKRPLEWMLVPFVDGGRVWTWEEGIAGPLLISGGAGARVNIQELLILRADVGVAPEPTLDGRATQVQVYVLAEHPF